MSSEKRSVPERAWSQRVAELLEEAQRVNEEDRRCGAGRRGEEWPEPLRTAAGRLERIRAAKWELEREAREKAGRVRQERQQPAGQVRDEAQKKRWQRHRSGRPAPEGQANRTDPESRPMVDGATKAYVQGYNAQLAVDGASPGIVAQDGVAERIDPEPLGAMVEPVERHVGRVAE